MHRQKRVAGPRLGGHSRGTRSFAVTVYDPDAPTGMAPEGSIQSRTDFGQPGYGGPCPPEGDDPHRYIFTVYALKTDRIDLDPGAPGAMVGFYLHQNTLDQARANLAVAKSNAAFTTADLARAQELVRNRTVTEQIFEQRALAVHRGCARANLIATREWFWASSEAIYSK